MARQSLKNVCRLIDSMKQELPKEQEFLNDLKRSIEMPEQKNKRAPSMTYKPSSMNCIRNMFYQRIGSEPDASTTGYALIGIRNSGSDIHVRIQNAVMDMINNNMDCEWVDVEEFIKSRNLDYLEIKSKTGTETKLFHKTLNMSFMCDGIIKYKNHYYILELKTESANKWWGRNGVAEGHYNQAVAYSTAFGIPEVMFVYISRDTLDMKSFIYTVTDEMKHELTARILECEDYVDKLTPPPKPENLDRKTCEYCGYKTQCRKDS